ncbi:MAG: T9SS type A sorting domain-containing protein [Cytophagaceae bacterium]
MRSKVFTLALLLFVCQSFVTNAQVTFTTLPDTPLDYFVFELTQPPLKAGYNKRSQYFGTSVANLLMGEIKAVKYSDLPLYSYYSEYLNFFDELESRTTISRTTNYVAYVLEARNSSSDPFVTYSKDTFFLNSTTITRISQTIYDTEDNTEDSYATYDVVYHTNGKIEKIELTSMTPQTATYVFGGVTCVYNANNTLNRDTIYDYGYNFDLADYGIRVYEYQDFLYKAANANQIDSIHYYNVDYTHDLNTKYTFALDANNRVLTQNGFTYDDDNDDYEQTYFFTYGIDATLSVISKDNVKTFQPYPNPTSDRIQLPDHVKGKEWSIYSATGVLMNKGVDEVHEWNVSSYEKGLYILHLTDGETSWQGKFIVK